MKKKLGLLIVIISIALLVSSCSTGSMAMKDDSVAGEKALVSGKVVTKDGTPLKGAYVYAYSSASRGQMGPSDFMSNATDDKGAFTMETDSGEYFIIARKRSDDSNVGVLKTGDYSSPTGFTLMLKKGSETKITLIADKIIEPMFFKKTGTEITDTGIKGVILDESGKPVAGAFAIAYKDKAMKTLPDFASVPTQADGSYTLFLPDAGKYYIGARVNTKKPPEKGELYGTYDKNADHSVEAKKSSFVEGVDVTLKPFAGTVQTEFKGFK